MTSAEEAELPAHRAHGQRDPRWGYMRIQGEL